MGGEEFVGVVAGYVFCGWGKGEEGGGGRARGGVVETPGGRD